MQLQLIPAGLIALASCGAGASAPQPASPYTGQESRDIKALSPEEVQSYLAGKGMGFAKAAELNGFPGPAHVLELAAPLGLTAEQRSRTQALFASMESRAQALGRALVEEERKLDRLFATKAVTAETLRTSLGEIASLQAQLRATHLEAHLAQVEILTPDQSARYAKLRGYEGAGGHSGAGQQHKH
jgi:Spy/CpxP family protein refolding chaperone